MHYWSLAVEEQFYLVYPAFLYLLVRKSQNPLMLTGGAAVLSFALCVLLTAKNQPMAFYMLPTRAWELLCGAMLAMHRARGGNFPVRMATAMGWCGAALIVVVIVLFSETPSFPGWLAALPVAGTVLLIASSNAESAPYNRLLSQPLMIAIGLRSYSLYLWHWPVYSFVDYALYQEAAGLRLGLKIVLTVVLSMLSYRFVEQPARVYLNRPRRKWIAFLGAGALIAAIVIGGSWLRSTLYYNVPPGSVAAGGLTVNGGQRAVVVLSGDSEAAMYGVTMAEIARRQGFTLYALGTAGHNQLPQEESTSWPAVVELARAKRPDIVVIVNLWTKLKNDPARIRQAIAEITPYCKRILIIAQQPRPPETASREAIRGGAKPPFVESSADRQAREVNTVLLKGLQNERVTVIDPAYLFIAPDGALRIFGDDWRMIYYDQVHLSDTGTRMTQNLLTQTLLGLIER